MLSWTIYWISKAGGRRRSELEWSASRRENPKSPTSERPRWCLRISRRDNRTVRRRRESSERRRKGYSRERAWLSSICFPFSPRRIERPRIRFENLLGEPAWLYFGIPKRFPRNRSEIRKGGDFEERCRGSIECGLEIEKKRRKWYSERRV